MRQQRFRHELAEREAAGERHGDAGERDAQRRSANPPHQPEIGLHPGEQKQQQDAELRDAVEHGLLLGGLGKERVLQIGQQRAERRRTKQNPAQQHPHDRGLTDTVHGLAQEPSGQHQRDQLREEDDLGGAPFSAFGRESRAGQEDEPDSATGGREQKSRQKTRRPDLNSARAPGHGMGLGRSLRRAPHHPATANLFGGLRFR
jgi:hypothetical protein